MKEALASPHLVKMHKSSIRRCEKYQLSSPMVQLPSTAAGKELRRSVQKNKFQTSHGSRDFTVEPIYHRAIGKVLIVGTLNMNARHYRHAVTKTFLPHGAIAKHLSRMRLRWYVKKTVCGYDVLSLNASTS